ncbi:hypothetical protein ABT294_00525 [Nonomuraea sp. NPDC000554]|uniref:hypothetical protein n=1 Tax=Nonomuraea sp. NPDC000554 TaxID=3154259 RepID=UPI003319154B
MPLPQSEGFEDRFRALERKVNDLFTSIQNQSGRTVASQGWLLRSMPGPAAPPSGDVYIYANGGRLWARSSFGSTALVDPPQASSVTSLIRTIGTVDDTISSVGSTYNAGELDNNFRDLAAKINEIISVLKSAGLMLP